MMNRKRNTQISVAKFSKNLVELSNKVFRNTVMKTRNALQNHKKNDNEQKEMAYNVETNQQQKNNKNHKQSKAENSRSLSRTHTNKFTCSQQANMKTKQNLTALVFRPIIFQFNM